MIGELLAAGHTVVGIDNFSKYGPVERSHDSHPGFTFVRGDCKDVGLMKELAGGVDQIIASAAMIGGISYFHAHAYDLLAENERITAATFDAAIWAFQHRSLRKINVMSSSMVFERATDFPSREGDERRCPPPMSTYGFQKLACEYFAQGAREQFGLPFTIIRPFNCVGIGEARALSDKHIMSGNIALAMSHVLPDLVQKIARGQDPLHLLGAGDQLRHYTYGGDLAKGVRACVEQANAVDEDFNLSTPIGHTVMQLAQAVWQFMRPEQPFRYTCDPPFPYDVQQRVPAVDKARRLLGFEATTPLATILEEVVPWVRRQISLGNI